MQILSKRELATKVSLYMYDNLTDIIDISSLPTSMFSTLVKLSTSPIEFPFTTSNSIFSFYLRWGQSFYEFPFIISFGQNWGNRFYEFPFTICLGLDRGNQFMNFLSPSILYVLYIFELGEINLYVSCRDDICLRFDNEGLSTIFYCTLS